MSKITTKTLAPITLFCYNRPVHLFQTIEALKKNELARESELFIFCDGSKNEKDLAKIKEVHKLIDNIEGFKNVVVEKSEMNKGLAKSIIAGVSKIVEKYGKIIVLEDDLITSPHFLDFMNDGLDFYENDERVASIHGYNYPVKGKLPQIFFLKGADCWGWATWKRGWDLFNPNGQELLDRLNQKNLTKEFDFFDTYDYTKMLKEQIAGKNDSWAIRWYASAFLENKLTLYPGQSLVKNIGLDDSGSNCEKSEFFDTKLDNEAVEIKKIFVAENKIVKQKIAEFFKKKKKRPFKNFLKKQKFNPDLFGIFINPFYFARRGLYKNIKRFSINIKGDVLDVGCGTKPYQILFDFDNYIGLDYGKDNLNSNKDADFFYEGNNFPFEDEQFDALLCSQVLEHVFNPSEFLQEINRVMKKGGYAIFSIPFVWDEHEQPYDYARYSSFGLAHLFKNSGFEIIASKKSSPSIVVIFQLINAYIYKIIAKNSKVKKWKRILINLLCLPFNILGLVLEKILPKNNDLYLDNVFLIRKK